MDVFPITETGKRGFRGEWKKPSQVDVVPTFPTLLKEWEARGEIIFPLSNVNEAVMAALPIHIFSICLISISLSLSPSLPPPLPCCRGEAF